MQTAATAVAGSADGDTVAVGAVDRDTTAATVGSRQQWRMETQQRTETQQRQQRTETQQWQ